MTTTPSTSPTTSSAATGGGPGTVLVIGSTGKTGRRVADRLTRLGIDVRPGSRSSPVPWDWEAPDSWRPALTGVDAAYVSYVPDVAAPGAYEAFTLFSRIVRQAGVSRLVLLSGRGEPEAQRCERLLLDSGLDVTVLRADWFAQNFSEDFFLPPVLSGTVALPVGAIAEPFLDLDDLADVAVATLTDDRHIGRSYELSGPRALTFAEAVAEIAAASGRSIDFRSISLEAYATGAREQGAPEQLIMLLRYLFGTVLDGRNSVPTGDVEQILGRPPTDFADYARKAAATGVWAPDASGGR